MTYIEFESTSFNGSESSGEILVSIVVSGVTHSSDINAMINLTEDTARS